MYHELFYVVFLVCFSSPKLLLSSMYSLLEFLFSAICFTRNTLTFVDAQMRLLLHALYAKIQTHLQTKPYLEAGETEHPLVRIFRIFYRYKPVLRVQVNAQRLSQSSHSWSTLSVNVLLVPVL